MLTSRVSLSDMTNQTITALDLTAERPEMVRSIIELIMADTISTFLEYEEYSHLRHLLTQPREDMVENYRQVTASLFLFDEYQQLLPLVDQLIDNIGTNLFSKMWEADESSTLREVLRCFGHGCSFWDRWDYTGFLGVNKMPKLKTTLESPYDVATQILDKIAERENLNDMLDVDSYLGKIDNDFGIWLASNYTPAGEDASNGEPWYLSKKPTDFMQFPLSKLREQYNLDNEIEDDEVEEDEPDNVTTFRIPEHYLSLIFNGDASGYEEEEIKAWEEFEQQMIANGYTNGHWNYPEDTEAYFSHTNDVHNLGDDVVDLQWVENSTEVRQLNNPPISRLDPEQAHIEF